MIFCSSSHPFSVLHSLSLPLYLCNIKSKNYVRTETSSIPTHPPVDRADGRKGIPGAFQHEIPMPQWGGDGGAQCSDHLSGYVEQETYHLVP